MSETKECIIEGCKKSRKNKRKRCSMHEGRMTRHGSPDALLHLSPNAWAPVDFWSRAILTANPDKCWEWQRGLFQDTGYGKFLGIGAHRVAWELFNGRPIEQGKYILHSCDNKKCINPHHLREGTHQDNMDDAKQRGRMHRVAGERHYMAKLTDIGVRHIRQTYNNLYTRTELAQLYNVTTNTIREVIKRNTWKHI